MAAVAYLDTHVVAWLFGGFVDLLSDEARKAIEQHDLLVSPMVVLELEYLLETKRVRWSRTTAWSTPVSAARG